MLNITEAVAYLCFAKITFKCRLKAIHDLLQAYALFRRKDECFNIKFRAFHLSINLLLEFQSMQKDVTKTNSIDSRCEHPNSTVVDKHHSEEKNGKKSYTGRKEFPR